MATRRKKPGPKPKRPPKELTARQVKFAHEFPEDFNGTKAAQRAGYSPGGAPQMATRLLRNGKVVALMAKSVRKQLKSHDIKASDVLDRATCIAFGDVRGFVDKQGRLLNIHEISDSIEPLVRGFKADPKTGQVTEILVENRLAAVKLLMQNFGLLKEQLRLEISSELTLEETEIIDAFTDEELTEWKKANQTIQRLLSPPSIDVMLLPASVG